MIGGFVRSVGFPRLLLVALIAVVSSASIAAEPSGDEDPFDPKRPLAAELEATVADPFTLASVGDCIISRPLSQKRSRDTTFDEVVTILRAADVTFGNLETSILDVREFEGYPDSGAEDWGLTSLPTVAADLVEMGFDLVGRANNHALDWGIAGMRETGRWLDRAGLVHAGTGENRGLARAPQYYESDKGRIALVSMVSTYRASSAATPASGSTLGRPGVNALRVERFTAVPPEAMRTLVGLRHAMNVARGVNGDEVGELPTELSLFGTEFRLAEDFAYQYQMNPLDLAEILKSVRLGKQHSDFLIASIHAHEAAFDGHSPAQFLKELAHLTIDAGADAFLTQGIHHLGPIEVYRGKPIFYGLANFFWSDIQEPLDPILHETHAERVAKAFPDPSAVTDADLTALLNADSFNNEQTFQSIIAVSRFEGGRVTEIVLHPIDLGYGRPLPDSGVPRLASPSRGQIILDRLQEISEPYGTGIFIERNKGFIRP